VGCGGWHGEGFEVTFLWMSDLVHVSEEGTGAVLYFELLTGFSVL